MNGRKPLRVLWDPRFLDYDFGPSHPFDERSRGLAAGLLESSLSPDESHRLSWLREAPIASPEVVERFHAPSYLATVRRLSDSGRRSLLDSGDTPSFPGCWPASSRIVGATVAASEEAVETGTWQFAPAGGLHHAAREHASGFCILNDLAVAIAGALSHGRRVAYVDLDLHHGDGVMYGFYDHGGVLDIDFHQDGRTLFPGTGEVGETGTGDGAGLKVNVPLPPGAGDEALVPLARRLVPSLLEQFRPHLLLVQHGMDGHWGDPLGSLRYTPSGYAAVDRLLTEAADTVGCPLVVTGGGGYRAESVSRGLALTGRHLAGLPTPAPGSRPPEDWRRSFEETYGRPAPERWVDPAPPGRHVWGSEHADRLVAELSRKLGRRFPSA